MNVIRLATLHDAERLLEIYAPYIEKTTISFEYEAPSLEEFQRRMKEFGGFYPYLVCEIDGKVIGYAYAHRYAERAAYGWGAEASIYVDENALHGGIGTALYQALLELLALQNVCTVYGCITWPNERSIGLHKKMGFREFARFEKSGFKFGRWIDVVWMEKVLWDKTLPPEPLVSVHSLDSGAVAEICARCASLIKERNRENV